MIPYKEYAAHKAAKGKASTTSKPTLEDEENWEEELPLPPHETLLAVKPVLPSQEDEWKLMVDQDPCSGSVVGDSGHGTIAVTPEDEPVDSNEELVGAMGGINENVSAENLNNLTPKCHHTSNTRCCLDTCPDIDRKQNRFIPQITPWKEALLWGVAHSTSFKGSSSIMLGA